MMQRRTLLTGLAGLPFMSLAQAQGFPAQPIKILGGFGAGSSSDVVMRLLAPHMQEALGQTVIVDNIAGAAGNIAAMTVARAKADGYTLVSATNSMLGSNPHMFPGSGMQPELFTPIAPISNIGLVVVAGPASPADTLAGVLEAGRKTRVTYGTPGAGTPMHLVGEMLRERSKGDMDHVAYKGGAAMVTDLVAGQISIGIVAYTPASGLIKAGKLKPLAVCGTSRLQALPNVPAVNEVVPGVNIGGWFALLAPVGTPASACALIASAAEKALALPAIRAQMIEMGCDPLKGWDITQHALARDFEILAPDWPGFGKEMHTPPLQSIAEMAEHVVQLADARGLRKFHIVGHSMSGFVVQHLLLEHPERIGRAVLYGTFAAMRDGGRFESVAATAEKLRVDGIPRTVERIVTSWFVKGSDDPHHAECVRHGQQMSMPAAQAAMAACGPVDFRARLCVLPRAAHAAHLEQPELFHLALSRFLIATR